MTLNDWIVMGTGLLVALCCSMVGTWLVLHRMSMMGDAIAHAVLPGIVVAFLWTGSRDSLTMMGASVVVALMMTFFLQWFRRRGVQMDAAIGVVMTTLFAVGVILVSLYASRIDLDISCVLYGEMHYAPWMRLTVGGVDIGVRPLWMLGATLIVIGIVCWIGHRRFLWCAFDPVMATVAGVSVGVVQTVLMGLVSMTTVVAFESVGAVLVLGMLVIPAVTASLWTRQIAWLFVGAIVIAVISAVGGYVLAMVSVASIAGCMVIVATGLLVVSVICSPERGAWRMMRIAKKA